MIELLTSSVQPTRWSDAGGAGEIAPVPSARALVIGQTNEGHRACEKLLADLRAKRHVEKAAAPDPNEMLVKKYQLAVKPESLDQCIAIVRATIEPTSWNAEGVYIVKIDNSLVIRQTRAVHEEVLAFLNSLGLMPARISGAGGGAF